MVALMTEALGLTGKEKVLEIGAGSGYQAAVLSLLAERVFTIERIPALASRARKVLDALHYSNVQIRVGDGTAGWPEEAPFDAIIVTAASPKVPQTYIDQLNRGGRLLIPVGGVFLQELLKITKKDGETVTENLGGCRFVKLLGRHGWQEGL
jgi:protein-L-isoaspartate(D-aspartate) O-methyltransferase